MKHSLFMENIYGETIEIYWYGTDDLLWEEIVQVSVKFGNKIYMFPTAETAYQWAINNGFIE